MSPPELRRKSPSRCSSSLRVLRRQGAAQHNQREAASRQAMLAFRSLDPFRALREPDRRRRDEERLSRSEQRTLSKTQNNHLTGKAPYKFESTSLQRRVQCQPDADDFLPSRELRGGDRSVALKTRSVGTIAFV